MKYNPSKQLVLDLTQQNLSMNILLDTGEIGTRSTHPHGGASSWSYRT